MVRNFNALIIGLAVVTLVALQRSPAAPAQEKPQGDWEFKAVLFGSDEKEATRKLNDLAADGWQYVGPLANSLVAFRRPAVIGGKITVEVTGNPATVAIGQKTTLTVTVRAADHSVLAGVTVTISAGGGKFLPDANTPFDPKGHLQGPFTVTGTTNEKGQFTTWWVANPAASGYGLSIEASKDNYTTGKSEYTIQIK